MIGSLIDSGAQFDPLLPSSGTDSLWRKSYTTWLDHHALYPLRFVVAQPGSGKTTATALWAQRRTRRTVWISLPEACSAEALWATLAERLGVGGVFCKLDSTAFEPTDVVVDDLENALPDARALLADLYRFAGDGINFIYLARTAHAVDIRNGHSVGLVAYGDGSLLHFDTAEVALLCDTAGVPFTIADCERLCRATAGWATAVAGTVWSAARGGARLADAYARWRRQHNDVVDAIVERAVRSSSPEDARLFTAVLAGRKPPSAENLRRLERAGLFVEPIDGTPRLNPVVLPAHVRAQSSTQPALLEPAVIEMFGRFRMIAGGRDVRFARRRDAQIVQYLALRSDGCATKAQLIDTFWPTADKQLAAQGLRTACSAIRRALAECVGRDAVDHYFGIDTDTVRLRFESVVSSAYRFRAHANLAISAAQRCEEANVHAHSTAALRLYTAPLLSGEPAAQWIDEPARELAFMVGVLRELNDAVAHPSDAPSRIA